MGNYKKRPRPLRCTATAAPLTLRLLLSGPGWRLQPGNHQPRLQDRLVGAQRDRTQTAVQGQEAEGESDTTAAGGTE